MKTIIDAVNELKGDIKNAKQGDTDFEHLVICKFSNKIWVSTITLTTDHHFHICTVKEFNDLVTELSNWRQTLQKVETVEHEGEAYEIGKLYKTHDGMNVTLIGISVAGNFIVSFTEDSRATLFEEKLFKSNVKLGTITPAPTKLIDGEAYQFDYKSSKSLIGILHTSIKFGIEHRMFCMPKDDAKYNSEFCTNIIPLSSNK